MSLNPAESTTFSPTQRWTLITGSVAILTGFALAALVDPDPRGFGTHQQFGFPPCSIRVVFGVPCPSCGGTTSVAHFVRGEWLQALRANVAVFSLATVCAAFVPWSWLSVWRGRLVGIRDPLSCLVWMLIGLSLIATLQWLFRVMG